MVGTENNARLSSSIPDWRLELDDLDGILLESAGDLPTELAHQSPRADPDPVMLRAGYLLLLSDPVGIMPGQALNDHGAQTEQQGQQGRIKPGQIHVSHLEFGFRPYCRIPVVL